MLGLFLHGLWKHQMIRLFYSNDSVMQNKWSIDRMEPSPMAHLLLKKNEPAKVGKHQIRGWEVSADHLFFVLKAISLTWYFKPATTPVIFRSIVVDGFSAPLLMCWIPHPLIGANHLVVSYVSNDLHQCQKSTKWSDWFSFTSINALVVSNESVTCDWLRLFVFPINNL